CCLGSLVGWFSGWLGVLRAGRGRAVGRAGGWRGGAVGGWGGGGGGARAPAGGGRGGGGRAGLCAWGGRRRRASALPGPSPPKRAAMSMLRQVTPRICARPRKASSPLR